MREIDNAIDTPSNHTETTRCEHGVPRRLPASRRPKRATIIVPRRFTSKCRAASIPRPKHSKNLGDSASRPPPRASLTCDAWPDRTGRRRKRRDLDVRRRDTILGGARLPFDVIHFDRLMIASMRMRTSRERALTTLRGALGARRAKRRDTTTLWRAARFRRRACVPMDPKTCSRGDLSL